MKVNTKKVKKKAMEQNIFLMEALNLKENLKMTKDGMEQ